jgi:2-polyprenyl-3-methyl-5-hydroxy-6-metoxy-1,4-benzoquinol methylase
MEALRDDVQPTILDVGAGHGWTGDFLERLYPGRVRRFDFIEPDETLSREIAGRKAHFEKRRLASIDAAQSGYDAIFLNHVLEHVAEPMACVRQVSALLAPGGVAYFETPYADQRFKSDVFPHTWFFTPDALAQIAKRTGLKEVLRVAFGRMPGNTGADRVWRAAFRLSAEAGLADLAGRFDDRVWRYAPAEDGIWLRWMVSRA